MVRFGTSAHARTGARAYEQRTMINRAFFAIRKKKEKKKNVQPGGKKYTQKQPRKEGKNYFMFRFYEFLAATYFARNWLEKFYTFRRVILTPGRLARK